MTFTDDDLKRLEALGEGQCGNASPDEIYWWQIKALLARLEAGEDRWDWHYGAKRICACMRCEAWRKACGK